MIEPSAISPKGAAIGAAEFAGDDFVNDFVQPSGGALKGHPAAVDVPPTPWIPPALRTTNNFKLADAGGQAPIRLGHTRETSTADETRFRQ